MKPVYRLTWIAARTYYALWHRWRALHPERVPVHGPVILAANHASYLDPPLIGSGLPRAINYLARESLFRFPGFGADVHGLVSEEQVPGGPKRYFVDCVQG